MRGSTAARAVPAPVHGDELVKGRCRRFGGQPLLLRGGSELPQHLGSHVLVHGAPGGQGPPQLGLHRG